MRIKTYFFILILLLTLFSTQKIIAQCGARNINTASTYYDVGQFDEVIKTLSACVNYENVNQQVESLRLLSNTYIALDSLDKAKEFVIELLILDPTFQARLEDPIMFQVLIRKVKIGGIDINVSSVSKISENIYEAPATVLLITKEEIDRRGYQDLEALLHDLPGFDISQSNGFTYSNIYQRGYRSANTDRTLLLVDGVEENNLRDNTAYLSRQYPLSNIESVEVIYGPASTIYGPNAFLGAISIKTKGTRQLIKEDKRVGVHLQTGYGQWNTKYVDATLAALFSENQIELTVTGRKFISDEPDFSKYDWLDFKAIDYPNEISLDSLNHFQAIHNPLLAQAFIDSFGVSSNLYSVNRDINGNVSSVTLTDEGAQLAINRDNALLENTNYADQTDANALSVRLKIFDITIGWQYWHIQEGTGPIYTDAFYATSKEGHSSHPQSQFYFMRYSKQVNRHFSINTFTRYKIHSFDGHNAQVRFKGYKSGELSLYDLMNGVNSTWDSLYLSIKSNQAINETYFTFKPSPKFSLFAGLDTRFNSIQPDLITSNQPNPESITNSPTGSKTVFSTDIGAYSQLTYMFSPKFKMILGYRFDYTNIAENSVKYNSNNPRIVLIHQPNDKWIFKGIYATAFKPATNFERFSTIEGQREVATPDLAPERVANYELSARRFIEKKFVIEVVGYQSDYKNTIESADTILISNDNDSTHTTYFTATGQQQIRGVHAIGTFRHKNFETYFNYTFTNPTYIETDMNGNPNGHKVRIGDMASHQFNLGANYLWNDFNFNLRMNWVGKRSTGPGTSVPTNLSTDAFTSYAILNGVISYDIHPTGIKIDLIANNIFNTEYFSPGVRSADGQIYSSKLPQKGRNIHFRLRYVF
jgi:outer membrane receptor for ferrienterochelin and colicins